MAAISSGIEGRSSGAPRALWRRIASAGGPAPRLAFAALGALALLAGCSSDPKPLPLMADSLLVRPVDGGRLSSPFGMRRHPIFGRRQLHKGIDWAAPRGTPVRAAGHGVIVAAAPLGSYGRYLRIDHGGGIATAYAHLDAFAPGLHRGRMVRQGELIGGVGSSGRATGPHLHYELLVAGRQVDPLAALAALAPAPAPTGIVPAAFAPAAAPYLPLVIRTEELLALQP